ncbi:hypothetical protein G6F60_014527 [Rhizopus arrhizus]|nr:hypothetical protein G6F60_014527 [Rhizopus arrhizus]
MLRQCEEARDELALLAPWPERPADAPWQDIPALQAMPTLQQVADQGGGVLAALRARLSEPGTTPDEPACWPSATT